MEWLILAAAFLGLTLIPARLKTHITIDAPPEAVWKRLYHVDAYGKWNPFIHEIRGELKQGARLRVTLGGDPDRPMTFAPTVRRFEEGEGFCWKGTLGIPWLFDGRHCFWITPEGDGRCRFTQSERFNGLLLWPLYLWIIPDTRKGFEAMNQALKDAAESNGRTL